MQLTGGTKQVGDSVNILEDYTAGRRFLLNRQGAGRSGAGWLCAGASAETEGESILSRCVAHYLKSCPWISPTTLMSVRAS